MSSLEVQGRRLRGEVTIARERLLSGYSRDAPYSILRSVCLDNLKDSQLEYHSVATLVVHGEYVDVLNTWHFLQPHGLSTGGIERRHRVGLARRTVVPQN